MNIEYIAVSLFGAVIGSFLNVCIFRLPRELSIVSPASRCPVCDTEIKFYDNIPVLSFLLLRGKCRNCRTTIPFRYPLVETLNALLYAATLWRFGLGWHMPVIFAFCSALLVITFIDLDFQIIPNTLTIPGTVIGLLAGSLIFPDPFARNSLLGFKGSLIGLVSGGGLFFLIAYLSQLILKQEAMGMGDVKMMAMIGAFMGWKAILLTTFSGSLAGSLTGIFMMAFRGKDRKAQIPFGPFLATGAIITLFYGREILYLYLRR